MKTLLQLEELPVYSEKHFLDLAQVDLLPQKQWSANHWTADKWEQIPQRGPGLMMAMAARLSSAGEHGCDELHDEAS